ncbi:alpha/beta fold hydrolase [Actinomadura montaniterrae]|uniref:Alpha/beta fold hydrolase n=1 Tax=Actinomadura montaniterrae TaxID=1803903 RepID=A0A6L3W1X3_9ACTN|nr:alpha/beta fold hydrolase [Actinomadura montaniterrae]KAB2388168.1 alpha/beta fold hydrolase [Actinomadura montaniterrae]
MSIWNALADVDYRHAYVDAGGIRTRALQAGPEDGEHVVFLHGTSGHLEAFVRNVPEHARHYRCHAIDMLGHGYTGKPDVPQEIPAYVDHLIAYLDAVGAERAHLVGESLGGWVSAWAASEHPERVASLQLLCMGGTKINPEVMERLKKTTTAASLEDDVELTRSRLRLLWAEWDEEFGDELTEVRYAIYHRPDFQKNLPNLLALQEVEIRERNLLRPDRMPRITAPTLVVWGNKNPFGDVPEAQAIADAIPGARLEIFNECGHWPQHEQAGRYNPISLAFLAEAR